MEMHFATVWESLADAIGDEHRGRPRRRRAARGGSTTIGPPGSPRRYDDGRPRAGHQGRPATCTTATSTSRRSSAAFKLRGVPINVNYRYLDDELWYLLDNSDCRGARVPLLARRSGRPGRRPPAQAEAADRGRRRRRPARSPARSRTRTSIAGNEPMPRIARREDDIYMLYTGGTTGMPKGVMYAMGGTTGVVHRESASRCSACRCPTDAAQVAPMVKALVERGEHGDLDPLRAADARHRRVARGVDAAPRRRLRRHADQPLARRRTSCSARVQRRAGDADHHRRRRVLQADHRGARRAPPRRHPVRHCPASKVDHLAGVMWTAEVKEQLLERIEQVDADRRHRLDRGHDGHQIMMKGLPAATAQFSSTPTTKVFTDDGRQVAPGLRRGRHGRRRRQRAARLLQGPRQVGGTFRVIDGRALLVPRRLGQGRRRRLADPARPGQPGDQLAAARRSSPRRSRRPSSGSRRDRLPRGRRRRRAVRPGGHRRRRHGSTGPTSTRPTSSPRVKHAAGRLQGAEASRVRRRGAPCAERQGRLPRRQAARLRRRLTSSCHVVPGPDADNCSPIEELFAEEVDHTLDAGSSRCSVSTEWSRLRRAGRARRR